MQATVCVPAACSSQHAAWQHATACHAICGIGRGVGSVTATEQQRSCADLMSASVFVSLFSLLLLFFVCVRLCHKFLFFLGSSLRKKRSDFTATTGGATCSSCSKSGRRFCRQQFANDERFKGGSSRQAGKERKEREGECGKWFVSSVFVNMKLSAPTRGTCQCVIQHSIPFANFAERRKSQNRNESKIITICGSRFFFGHDAQTGSNYATQQSLSREPPLNAQLQCQPRSRSRNSNSNRNRIRIQN